MDGNYYCALQKKLWHLTRDYNFAILIVYKFSVVSFYRIICLQHIHILTLLLMMCLTSLQDRWASCALHLYKPDGLQDYVWRWHVTSLVRISLLRLDHNWTMNCPLL